MKTTRVEFRVKSEELTPAVANRWTSRSFSTISHLPSPTSHSTSHSTSGFSLVEVMISIGIVAFAVVGILTAFPVGIEAARDARDENTAAFIADDIFTRLRAQPFSTLKGPKSGGFFTYSMSVYNGQWSYNPPAGSNPSDQLFYYTVDGMPANAASGGMGTWGTQPTAGAAYKSDEGYFGARVYVNVAPYYKCAGSNNSAYNGTMPKDVSIGQSTGWAGGNWGNNLMSLADVIVEISWPARQPYNNRVGGHVRSFHSAIVNLH